MKIQESFAHFNKDGEPIEIKGSMLILADDGRSLFEIKLEKDGNLRIHAGMACKHNGQVLDTALCIKPECANAINLYRSAYQ